MDAVMLRRLAEGYRVTRLTDNLPTHSGSAVASPKWVRGEDTEQLGSVAKFSFTPALNSFSSDFKNWKLGPKKSEGGGTPSSPFMATAASTY